MLHSGASQLGSASVGCFFPAHAPRQQAASPGLTSTEKLSLETTRAGTGPCFPLPLQMAVNACMGNIHAPRTKRSRPFPFQPRLNGSITCRYKRRVSRRKYVVCCSHLSSLLLNQNYLYKKNPKKQATRNSTGQLLRKPNPSLASACLVVRFAIPDVFPKAPILQVTQLGENYFLKCYFLEKNPEDVTKVLLPQ